MELLKSITVCVDFVSPKEGLEESSLDAVNAAFQMATEFGSTLRFVHVMDVDEEVKEQILSQEESSVRAHYEAVEGWLAGIVARGHALGAQCESRVLFGKVWITLIRSVLRDQPQLVLLGTTRKPRFKSVLLGNTALKLLRKCPSPVWVVKPPRDSGEGGQRERTILVAHDLTSVGRHGLAWGARLSRRLGLKLTVLHVLEPLPQYGFAGSVSPGILGERRRKIQRRLEEEVSTLGDVGEVEIRLEEGTPSATIYRVIQGPSTEMVVMGTVARSGVSGLLTGNTAETLLPWIPCSLLALKPQGFRSPVTLESP